MTLMSHWAGVLVIPFKTTRVSETQLITRVNELALGVVTGAVAQQVNQARLSHLS